MVRGSGMSRAAEEGGVGSQKRMAHLMIVLASVVEHSLR